MNSIVSISGLPEEQVKSNYHYKVIGFFLVEPRLTGRVLLLPFSDWVSAERVPCRDQHIISNKAIPISIMSVLSAELCSSPDEVRTPSITNRVILSLAWVELCSPKFISNQNLRKWPDLDIGSLWLQMVNMGSYGTSAMLFLSRVWLFATPWTAACQAPLSMGVLQARVLEWVAMPSSRGSSQPRDRT